MSSLVKLCGLMRPQDIEAANVARPDMVGFILSKGFRRSIKPRRAIELIERLDENIAAVGVFVNEPIRNVARFTHSFDFDGYDAARQIRALDDPKKASIPIVAVTANAFAEDRELALSSGMNAHLAKPYDIDVILKTLSEILSK